MVTAEAPQVSYGTYGSLQESDFSRRAEEQKSFNALASVNMMRYDQQHFGRVLPETFERVRDEEMSLLVEGVGRASRTKFMLPRIEGDLCYYKNGEWKSYVEMLETGKAVALREAKLDPRREFLADDSVRDLEFGEKMQALKPGEKLFWGAAYPYRAAALYGDAFMQACGRFPDRWMGFLYEAYCDENGNVLLESQTIDRTDDEAIAAAIDHATHNPSDGLDGALTVYDAVLGRKLGGDFHAGRLDAELRENAWNTVLAQKDLIHYFLSGLQAIAARPIHGWELEETTKRHMYGVWAAFKKRIDGGAGTADFSPTVDGRMPVAHYTMLEREVHQAFTQFAAEGRPMIGCGGVIEMLQGEANVLTAPGEVVFKAIFGNKPGDGPDGLGPLTFKCKYGHHNKRTLGNLVKKCQDGMCPDPKGSVGCA